MNRLLLDVGNSRIKWVLLRGRYRRHQAFVARGAISLARLDRPAAAWQRLLAAAGAPVSVHVCNVAGTAIERRLRTLFAGIGVRPCFARTVARAGGVRNAYPEPWRLGVDRWVGLIGARHEWPGQHLCIVGIGTAMTIDLLDADGGHRGGSITPGPQLMVDALLDRTAGIRRRAGALHRAIGDARPGLAPLFARNTRGALQAGARYGCAALIERAVSEANLLLARRPRLIVTGGGAAAVVPALRRRYWREDDLVLRGLAVLAERSARDAARAGSL